MNSSKQFYEKFPKKLLNDYLNSNQRIEIALYFILQQIDPWIKNILDIGCGIGWSSYEMAKQSTAKILAVDLSDANIAVANKLFFHPKIDFKQIDITKYDLPKGENFDLVVLIDVFEHIPKEDRMGFYTFLNNILSENGKIVLTCPTVFHQQYLKKYNPAGLQPVDEEVDLDTLLDFAKSVNAEVIHFEYKNIWNRNDYFHAVIERNINDLTKKSKSSIHNLESVSSRIKRISRIPNLKEHLLIPKSSLLMIIKNRLKYFIPKNGLISHHFKSR